jgi:hypothetical protein
LEVYTTQVKGRGTLNIIGKFFGSSIMSKVLGSQIYGFSRNEVQQIFDSPILWNNLLTYCLDKQLGFRNRENPTPNSASLMDMLQILKQNPPFMFCGITKEELEKVKSLSRHDYTVMLQRVTSVILREKGAKSEQNSTVK